MVARRSLHAPAQVDGDRLAVIADLEIPGDIGNNFVTCGIQVQQGVSSRYRAEPGEAVAWAGEGAAPRPAVLADLFDRLNDEWILAKAILNRR